MKGATRTATQVTRLRARFALIIPPLTPVSSGCVAYGVSVRGSLRAAAACTRIAGAAASAETPLVPVRMVNEYVYCPRLAFLEWVDGEWADSADTEEGRRAHVRL